MRALVTGAAGFIGAHVARALAAAGHEVRALHLPTDPADNLDGLRVERVAGDVLDRDALREAMRGCDRVFHLAAVYALWTRDPGRMRDVNVIGTRNVLELAASLGVGRVVHTSSIARFGGQGPGREADEGSPFALGPTGDLYSRSKAEAHALAEAHARQGLDVVIVAPGGPVGPGDIGPTPTGRLLLAAVNLPALAVLRSETLLGDVRSMALGHLAAAERGQRGRSYLLGDESVSQLDLARRVHALIGAQRPVVEAPFAAAELAARGAEALARLTGRPPLLTPAAVRIARLGLRASAARSRRELGLTPGSVDRALADALRWFAQRGMVTDRAARERVLADEGRTVVDPSRRAP